MTYQGLILDFGGVITTSLFGELEEFCVREGLPRDAFVKAIRDNPEGRAAFAGVENGTVPQREFETTLAGILGVRADGMLWRMLGGLTERPGILGLVARARAAGLRTACLSNSWGEGQFDHYREWDLYAKFDVVVVSGQGLRKPDPEIYQLTLDKLGLPGDACVFADDTAANLPPARELGLTTVHFTSDDDTATVAGLLGL